MSGLDGQDGPQQHLYEVFAPPAFCADDLNLAMRRDSLEQPQRPFRSRRLMLSLLNTRAKLSLEIFQDKPSAIGTLKAKKGCIFNFGTRVPNILTMLQ